MSIKLKAVLTILLGVCSSIYSAGLILGDRTDTSNSDSFSFNLITRSVFDTTNQYFYVASAGALTGDARQYAIAGTTLGAPVNAQNGFIPFAPETVTLDGTANSSNPLYGVQIGQLGIVGTTVVAVPNGDSDAIYWITSRLSSSTQSMVSVTTIKDANNANSAGVVTVGDNAHGCTLTGTGNTLFAAVKPNGGNFGTANGGIAVFTKTATTLTQEKAVDGDDSNIKAVEIALDTDAIKMGAGDLVGINANAVDLHWDSTLERLYIAVRAGNAGADGARPIIVARVETSNGNKKLKFAGIAPAAAFTGGQDNEIVGSPQGPGQAIHIYNVRTMHTSTGLSYLIVRGDASNTNALTRIYALPLVNEKVNSSNNGSWATSATHGTLAKVSSTPTNYFGTAANGLQVFTGRGFQTQASAAGDLYTESSVAAKVGVNVVPGTVSDIQVYKDAVFVSTSAGTDPETAGVFYSQAIFDTNGKIAQWTPWQRVYYMTDDENDGIDAFAFSSTKGQLFTVEGTAGTPDAVKRTDWGTASADGILGGTSSDSSVGFIEKVSAQFPESLGGIMGLFDFDKTNPAFNQGDDNNLSLMIATGYNKVVIVKTGTDTGGTFNATIGDFTTAQRTFTGGAIGATSSEGAGVTDATKIVSVSGGDLNDLGAITCATIVEDPVTNGGYIAVGGTGGVALLRSSSYAGWATGGLVQDLSTGLGTGLSFQKIGTYSNVRKLWTAVTTGSTQALYILTDDTLYRIDATDLNDATPTPKILATVSGLGLASHHSFADFVASKTLGLLATSNGLYRTGNTYNISTAANEAAVSWTQVTLPSSFTGVTKLIPLSKSALPYEFADGAPGQVYYIASTVSFQSAALGRLAIADASTAVASTTVLDVAHPVLKNADNSVTDGVMTFLGRYRGNFATNGATLLITSPQQLSQTPQLVRLPLAAGVGTNYNYKNETEISLDLDSSASTLLGLTRNSATGSWLTYGDFGLRVLE